MMKFIYQNQKGLIKIQNISNVCEKNGLIQGYCVVDGHLKTFRRHRILEVLSPESNALDRLEYHRDQNQSTQRAEKLSGCLEICFTGFKKADKDELISLAEGNGMIVRKGVTKNLSFLCCGYNAGSTKITEARAQNVVALSEFQFHNLIDNGEIPETDIATFDRIDL